MVKQEQSSDSNLMAASSYILFLFTGLLVYLLEKEDKFIRFHAVQSMIVGVVLFIVFFVISVLSVLLAFIPIIGWIIGILLTFGYFCLVFILWIFLIYKAYNGKALKVPVLGNIAKKYA